MNSYLFIRFSSLGDTILTTGVIRAFMTAKDVKPPQIHILTYSEFAQVWQNLIPAENIHVIHRKISFLNYIKFVRKLPEFDYIFDWHANLRSAITKRLVKGKTYTCKKHSFARRLYVRMRLCKNKLNKHTVQRYAESLFPVFGMETPPLEDLRPILFSDGEVFPNRILLHPFASKFTKIWPHFAELAERLAGLGYDVLVAGKGDFPETTGVVRAEAGALDVLFNTIASTNLVITTDSGPMHAAVALNKPVIAIFGSTTRPLGFYPDFNGCEIMERLDVPCRPCHVHGLNVCPRGHFDCMKISADDICRKISL